MSRLSRHSKKVFNPVKTHSNSKTNILGMVNLGDAIPDSVSLYDGYELRTLTLWDRKNVKHHTVCAFTPEGLYIGNEHSARYIINAMGIVPELAHPGDRACSIGFQETNQKWFGWSHRGIVGFGYGDMIFDPTFIDADTPYSQSGCEQIEDMEQAREAAIAFAEYIA